MEDEKAADVSTTVGAAAGAGTPAYPTSESLYRSLVEKLPQKVFAKDAHFRWLSINENFARDLGIEPGDCVGKTDYDFFPAELADKYRADDQRVMASGQTEEFEEAYVRGGERRVVRTTKAPLRDPQGAVIGVIGVFWDVTDQRRAEEAQRRSERELVIKNRIANVFLTMPDEEMYGEVLRVVQEVMNSPYGVFGYLDEEGALVVPSMTRDIWWEQCNVPEKDIRFPRDAWGCSSWPRAIREGTANYSNEPSALIPQGHVSITRHISMPIVFRGEVIGLLQVANRETDYREEDLQLLASLANQLAPLLNARVQRDREERRRRQAEEELRQHRDHLEELVAERSAYARSLVEAGLDALVTIGQDGTITDVNRASEELTGVERAVLVGSDFADYFTEPERAREVYRQVFAQGVVRDYPLTVRHRSGRTTDVSYNLTVYRNDAGEVQGVFAAARDVTEQKRAQEVIQRQSQEIMEISTPVMQVWEGVVVAPLIGMLDSQRTQLFMERLLNAIVGTNSPVALVDITGVPMVDTQTAQHLIDTIAAVRLLGAQVILTGVRPAIAQTLVHLGVDLSGVTTRPSLMAGLRVAMESLGSAAGDASRHQRATEQG